MVQAGLTKRSCWTGGRRDRVLRMRTGRANQSTSHSATATPVLRPGLLLDLSDRVRAGFFGMVCIMPSSSTWSRARHHEPAGQQPERSRSKPFGLDGLSREAQLKVTPANQHAEFTAFLAREAPDCTEHKVALVVDDFGGEQKRWCNVAVGTAGLSDVGGPS